MKTGDAGAPHFGFTTVTTNVDPWQNGDSVVFFPVRSANLLRTFNVNDGSGNSADDVGDIDESYHVYEIVRNGLTDTQFYQDGSLLETRTNNIPNADTHLYFSSHGIASGDHLSTMDYTFVRKYTANPPIITFGAEQLDTLSPDINTTLSTPINNTYTQFNNFTFNIVGNFTTANATLFIDSIPQWNGSITTGLNTAQNITLTEGMRSWYINASATSAGNTTYNQSSNESFYYDISNPTVPTVQINPDYVTISDGTIVNINLSWADNLQLKNGTFYIDTGSGYSEDSNTTLSGTSDWFNTSINTSGMVGNTITWKQEVYDQAGNNYTYSDSFYVALPNLLIYVYDETTGAMILPSDVVVFNEAVSRSATINGSTKISTLDYGNFTTGKYIVRVNADGYYTRRSIALIDTATVSSLNVYLPDVNESVIYDSFSLIDNTGSYNMSDIILRLDKPMPNGSDAVYQSYFDFDGSASTYLITDDMYKLFVITPDNTINYGWLNPDPDGDITIVLSQINIDVYFNDWLQVDYSADDDTRLISVTYESDNTIDFAFFTLLRNGVEVYNASALTDAGSFTYNASVDGEYLSRLDVYAAGEDFSQTWTKQYGDVYVPFLPDVYPQWMLNLISVGIIIIFLLAFGQYRADVAVISAVVMMGLTYRFGWLDTNAIVVSIGALIAASAVVTRMRKEGT